ncbi:hypothetical protein HYPBUDRAFT_145585 [Hyphopichia burtonii NRRL Y-1933]|uniref:LicD/FKTN/FKRP nucleotidyltransferase domain-containing protein n=1 Tax=Hyphopichia burtonii NRRL Y-1933 TaxID=984485 RepID=A0A1E4RBV1_9ASCO|nr:hypothetical protein HYPBUDRAFT_145585 [Hyphopichia burtonii NRRL Y-1933]ODV64748.1 hypothetical protein HYPBUDRAFT_145585 [Hyphopichia burtonii NRRL Y-1933]
MNIQHKLPFQIPRILRSRPSTKLVKLILLSVVFINILYFSFFYLGEYRAFSDLTRIYSDPYRNSNDQSQSPQSLNKGGKGGRYSTAFEKLLNKKFEKVKSDKERYWLAHTELTEISVDIPIVNFLKQYQNNNDNSWLTKNALFFDPRFTLSMYINELKTNFLQFKKPDQEGKVDANSVPTIKLPFHWSDWMDLSLLNEDLAKPIDQRVNCDYIRQHTNNNPDPSYFCKNNDQLSDEEIKKFGFQSKSQLPGFIIHGHSSHDDRPFNDFRVLESKSYALTHLPKPHRVILLNGDKNGGTFEFEVDLNDNTRLVESNIINNYLSSNNLDSSNFNDKTVLNLNHIKEYQQLLDSVKPRYLTDEEDIQGMYKVLRKQTDPKQSRELELPAKLFDYPETMIHNQIYFYEQKNDVPVDNLPINERHYYEGLKQCSNYDSKNEPTYFKMATIRIDDDRNRDREWGWHYDWRFFNGALNYDSVGWTQSELIVRTNIILDRLLRNWNRFAEEKGIVTWIMHGPLLSWYWDGLMFPFDVDIDIQMPMIELARLAKDYNQTLVLEDPTEGYGKFLIDVGTYIHNRDISQNSNHIDARFVDVDSGIYIDITALAKSKANTPEEYNNNALVNINKGFNDDQIEIYNDRRKHFYTLEQLSPLKYSLIGGVPVYVPLTITDRLIFEYSKGLSSYEFRDWYFVNRLNLWLRKEQIAKAFPHYDILNKDGNVDKDLLLNKINHMSDNEVLKLLEDDDILVEYYLTKEVTDTHAREKEFLFDSMGRDNSNLDQDLKLKEEYNQLTSTFKMSKPLRKALWDFENLERLKHHKEDV